MAKMKALHLLISTRHLLWLLLLIITSCKSIDVNVIPEVFSPPTNLRDGAFYGASLALCTNNFYIGAPFPARDNTGVFNCNLGTQQCQRNQNGLAGCEDDASNKKIFECAKHRFTKDSKDSCEKKDISSDGKASGYFSSTRQKSTATAIVNTNSDPTGGIKIAFTKTDFDDVEIEGFQYGEKFGHSICAVDIDNDGFDDLVVGAPFHARNEQRANTGAIYVFHNPFTAALAAGTDGPSASDFKLSAVGGFTPSADMERIPPNTPILTPDERLPDGARYGSSILNIGKLDDDQFDDFVVGAPYGGEDHQGVIYLYRGSETWWSAGVKDYYQKILPTMGGLTAINMRGFGYSFSNKETRSGSEVLPYFVVSSVNDDYNSTSVKNNQAESDQAILLDFFCVNLREKCNSKIESSKKTLKPIDDFDIFITLPEFVATKADVKLSLKDVAISGDDRVKVANNEAMPVDFVKNKQITFKRSISVKDDDVTQLQKPINLVADLTWNSPSAGDFAEKLKLDPINIFTGCESEEISKCKCNLELKLLPLFDGNGVVTTPLVVGDIGRPKGKIEVSNNGSEPSFDATLTIKSDVLSKDDSIKGCKSLSRKTEGSDTVFDCVLNKLTRSNATSGNAAEISFEYDMSTINGNQAKIDVTLNQSCSTDEVQQQPITEISKLGTIELKYEYTISSLASNDHPEAIAFDEGEPIQFHHKYVITNSGPSPPNKVEELYLYLPTPIFKDLKNNKSVTFEKVKTDVEVNCNEEGEIVEDIEECNPCTRYTCSITTSQNAPFLDDTSITGTIDFMFNATKEFLDELKEAGATKKNSANNLALVFEFPTVLKAKDQAEPSSITTTLRLRRTETGLTQFVQEWWPIIAGCAGGIILFGIVMYAAYRYGLHNKMRFTRAAAMAKDNTYEAL